MLQGICSGGLVLIVSVQMVPCTGLHAHGLHTQRIPHVLSGWGPNNSGASGSGAVAEQDAVGDRGETLGVLGSVGAQLLDVELVELLALPPSVGVATF